jgi:hypothetical protein
VKTTRVTRQLISRIDSKKQAPTTDFGI